MLAPLTSGLSAANPTNRAMRAIEAHHRAVCIHGAWVRDSHVISGPDGYYHHTESTHETDLRVRDETVANIGLGQSSLVGWHVRVWRSNDLVTWQSMGASVSLEDSIWYQVARDTFDKVPRNLWKILVQDLHRAKERWAIIFTSPTPLKPAVGASLLFSQGSELRSPCSSPLGDRIGVWPPSSRFRDDDVIWWMMWGGHHKCAVEAESM